VPRIITVALILDAKFHEEPIMCIREDCLKFPTFLDWYCSSTKRGRSYSIEACPTLESLRLPKHFEIKFVTEQL